ADRASRLFRSMIPCEKARLILVQPLTQTLPLIHRLTRAQREEYRNGDDCQQNNQGGGVSPFHFTGAVSSAPGTIFDSASRASFENSASSFSFSTSTKAGTASF